MYDYEPVTAKAAALLAKYGGTVTLSLDTVSYDPVTDLHGKTSTTQAVTAVMTTREVTTADGRLLSQRIAKVPTGFTIDDSFIGSKLTTADGNSYVIEAIETINPTGSGQPIVYTLVLS